MILHHYYYFCYQMVANRITALSCSGLSESMKMQKIRSSYKFLYQKLNLHLVNSYLNKPMSHLFEAIINIVISRFSDHKHLLWITFPSKNHVRWITCTSSALKCRRKILNNFLACHIHLPPNSSNRIKP